MEEETAVEGTVVGDDGAVVTVGEARYMLEGRAGVGRG